MRRFLLFTAILAVGYGQVISQNDTIPETEQVQEKYIIKKIVQDEKDRVVDPQNEEFLYEATRKLIKNQDFADFSIIISWYKQTKTHYYYQIGWNINGQNALDYMKYNWADGSVGLVSKEEMEADTDYSLPDGKKN